MPFNYKAAQEAGVSNKDIINYLTQSRNYNVDAARSSGASDDQIIEYLSSTASTDATSNFPNPSPSLSKPVSPLDAKSEEIFSPFFAARETDTTVKAGLKSFGNIGSSIKNFLSAAAHTVAHPVATAQSLINIPRGLGQSIGRDLAESGALGADYQKRIESVPKDIPEQAFDALSGLFIDPKTDDNRSALDRTFSALQRTSTNDPLFFGSIVTGILRNAAVNTGNVAKFDNLVSQTSKVVTSPIRGAANTVKSSAKFGTSQATGLNPSTIDEVVSNPSAFSKAARSNTTREALGNDVFTAIEKRLNDLGETGKGYQEIRRSAGSVSIDLNGFKNILAKRGIDLDENNQIRTSAESIPLTNADRSALQEFVNVFGNKSTLTNNAFLNARQALSNLSAFDTGKSNASTALAKDLRAFYDKAGKKQISGLKKLDNEFSSEKKILKEVQRDYFKKDGSFKDGAITKIANLNNKGREQILGRLQNIVPDVDQRIRLVRAVEDIESAFGNKIGTYGRGGLIAGSALFNQVGLAIALILTNPSVAVPLLRALGFSKQVISGLMGDLMKAAHDVNNFRLPRGEGSIGLATRDITKQSKANDRRIAAIDKELSSLNPDSNATRIARLEDERKSLLADNKNISSLIERGNQ